MGLGASTWLPWPDVAGTIRAMADMAAGRHVAALSTCEALLDALEAGESSQQAELLGGKSPGKHTVLL